MIFLTSFFFFSVSQWRNASAAAKGSRGSAVRAYDSTQARQDAEKIGESAKETLSKGVDDVKDFSQDAKAKTEDLAGSVADKTKEGTKRVAETAESVNESAKKYAYETKDKAEEAAGSVADKTNEVAGSVKDALEDAGEKAKQSAEGAWETAKDATQNVKETVVGKDE